MSAFDRIKAQIRYKQSNPGGSGDVNMTFYGGGGNMNETIVLPEKPKKRRKIDEVQKESKNTLQYFSSKQANKRKGGWGRGGGATLYDEAGGIGGGTMEIDDDEESEEGEDSDDENENKEPTKVPWGPSDIMKQLDNPDRVNDIQNLIYHLKKTEANDYEGGEGEEEGGKKKKKGKGKKQIIVWDHSKTKEGEKSDRNFFYWLEAYAADQTRKIMEKENLLFE